MNPAPRENNPVITHFKGLFVLLSAVLIITGVVSYSFAAKQMKEQLARRCHALAATVAVLITEDSDGYAAFLSDMDIESDYYQATKALMRQIKDVNADHVTYIYTVVQVDENAAMYIIGGEAPDSPVYTAPGVIDTAVTDAWRAAFQEQKAVLGQEFIDTPYGVRLSSYEPIFHRETGEFLGLVGADVTKSQYGSITNLFIIQTVISLLAGVFVFGAAIWRLSGSVNFTINRERYDAAFARQVADSGRAHYQKMDQMYDRLRVLRHDYKYHLNATRKMLEAGDTAGADRYLTSIEEQLSGSELKRFCQNNVINALVADYAERCEKMGIEFHVTLQMPDSLGIADYDLCIILGNLLENAVEASGRLLENRVIRLETRSIPSQLLFMVKNNFDGVIEQKDGIPISKKTYGGFGLSSVQAVIAAHGGDITFEWDENSFTAFVAVGLNKQ